MERLDVAGTFRVELIHNSGILLLLQSCSSKVIGPFITLTETDRGRETGKVGWKYRKTNLYSEKFFLTLLYLYK